MVIQYLLDYSNRRGREHCCCAVQPGKRSSKMAWASNEQRREKCGVVNSFVADR